MPLRVLHAIQRFGRTDFQSKNAEQKWPGRFRGRQASAVEKDCDGGDDGRQYARQEDGRRDHAVFGRHLPIPLFWFGAPRSNGAQDRKRRGAGPVTAVGTCVQRPRGQRIVRLRRSVERSAPGLPHPDHGTEALDWYARRRRALVTPQGLEP